MTGELPGAETSTLMPTMSLEKDPVLRVASPVADSTVVSPLGSVKAKMPLVVTLVATDSRWLVLTAAVLVLQQLWIFTREVAAWARGGPMM